jgi:pSer/pThr/pTyr-binding forkhead associated (FHA) protein
MPTLSIQLPGLPPVSHVLKDETITIGRMKGNTIVIEDSSISLMHAKITRKNGDFLLKDLNSTNGTVVNGQPVGEVSLRDLDRVRFADISCQFLADAVPAEQPAPAAAAPAPVRPAVLQPAPPAPAIAAGPTAKPSQARSPKRSSLSALRYAGAGLAVTVVSLVGWRFFQLNQESSRKSDAAPTATLAATPKALTEGKAQTLTPKQGKSSPEPASKLSDEISQAPNNEPQISGILAEHKAESATEGIPPGCRRAPTRRRRVTFVGCRSKGRDSGTARSA